jgi:hypothetical protein
MMIGSARDARAQRSQRLARRLASGRPMPWFWVACGMTALIVAVRIAIAVGQFHPVVVLPLVPHL